jgi:uncharacterized protein
MLLIKTFVRASAVHGLGLFAAAAIPKHTPIWRFDPWLDRIISPGDLLALPEAAREFVSQYGFRLVDGGWIVDGDNARFMNHGSPPNQGKLEKDAPHTVALRDIAAGEEILCDYYAFDTEAGAKLGADVVPFDGGAPSLTSKPPSSNGNASSGVN